MCCLFCLSHYLLALFIQTNSPSLFFFFISAPAMRSDNREAQRRVDDFTGRHGETEGGALKMR